MMDRLCELVVRLDELNERISAADADLSDIHSDVVDIHRHKVASRAQLPRNLQVELAILQNAGQHAP